MRWIFLFLLIINIAYIAWGLTRPTQQNKPVVVANKDVAQVVLLYELEQDKASSAQADKKQQKKPAQSKPDKTKPEPEQAKGFACYTLGPFRKLEVLSGFTRSIKDYVVEASFRSREETEQSIFWVYLRPEGGKKGAQVTRKKLTANKIKDHYIISSGDNINGVSLGHFREMDRAFKLGSRVEKLGFAPVVEPVFKPTTIYWLDYRVQASKSIPEAVFDQHLDQKISRFDRPCT